MLWSEGDSLSYDRGMKFSAKDQDNDDSDDHHCAQMRKGGWWYKYWSKANLNGEYLKGDSWKSSGITWHTFRGSFYSLKKVEMKLRPF